MKNHAPGEYYHVYNRGIQKQPIFEIESDYLRFLFLTLTFQGEHVIKNISREIRHSVQNRILHIDEELINEILKNRIVELVNFCLMPNHFHFLLKELQENGISRYMQRLLIAYTKYFNLRHNKTGHLFQGAYRDVHVDSDEQLMHVSAYIHKNPCELKNWFGKEDQFPWSSYQDCLDGSRFGSLLKTDIITERFTTDNGAGAYRKFVNSSTAKEFKFTHVQNRILHSFE